MRESLCLSVLCQIYRDLWYPCGKRTSLLFLDGKFYTNRMGSFRLKKKTEQIKWLDPTVNYVWTRKWQCAIDLLSCLLTRYNVWKTKYSPDQSKVKRRALSKFWKQIAGKFLKANRWKIFESFLKANRWKIFDSFLIANRWKIFESKSLAKFWKLWNRWRKLDNENLLSKLWKLRAFKISRSLEFSKFWKQSLAKFWTLSFQKAFN